MKEWVKRRRMDIGVNDRHNGITERFSSNNIPIQKRKGDGPQRNPDYNPGYNPRFQGIWDVEQNYAGT